MKFRIRSKFVGILVIASTLPLLIALATFYWFGTEYYRRSQGIICQTAASEVALSISRSLRHEIELLDAWVALARTGNELLETRAPGGAQNQPEIKALDSRWPQLPPGAPEVLACTQNEIARQLREFQKRNPRFAEILVADDAGRLIAATNKTSDYWQGDEIWWHRGLAAKRGTAYVEGLTFDESANSHAIELTLPLFAESGEQPVGILKGVLNVMPFLQKIPPVVGHVKTVHEVVLGSGEILSRLGSPELVPFSEKRPSAFEAKFRNLQPAWGEEFLPGQGRVIFGCAPIGMASSSKEDLRIEGLKPMWALAYRDERAAMAPVRNPLRIISIFGLGMAIGFILLGYYIASQKIIAPLNSLRRTAQSISRTVKLEEGNAPPVDRGPLRDSAHLLDAVHSIRTGDEIEDLAGEFAFMGQRILSYHEKLESEIAEKTREIRRDLEFARQFQANLMPRKYPEVPPSGLHPAVGLSFHHVYKPASTMGGDFFNVLKLSDTQAGVFIADVMGHGARSALVTAIIATLLQDVENRAGDPAAMLCTLNEHFHRLVDNTGELLFVSAFYLILDTADMTATYASAGHPSPLLVDRQDRQVIELTPNLKNNPALGLFKNHSYESFQRPLREGDLFLLFTDGLFECVNPQGEEFGRDRLKELAQEHQSARLREMIEKIFESVGTFTGQQGAEDDVCLVGVEISPRS